MNSSGDALQDEVVRLIAAIVARYTREYEEAAARFQLTAVQAKVLVAADEPVPMHQLAETLNSQRSNLTGIVDRLEARGLLERRPDAQDRRIKNVVVTAQGRSTARRFQQSLRFAAAPLNGLSTADRRQLRDLLARIATPDASPPAVD